ncbi:MAG: PRC-barrel domain-containing protein [Bacillota bacterium]
MNSASTVSKLSIVSINEGEQVAVVKSLLVNRISKQVEYLSVVHSVSDALPALLSFKDITGIGKDYIVIKSADDIKKANDDKSLAAVADECLLLTGISVLSSSGNIIGTITDYMIDEKSGKIEKLLLNDGQEVDGRTLLTLSAKFVLVDVDGETDDDADTEVETGLDEGSIAFLLGKTMNTDITSEDGAFSITKGTVLTQELIDKAAKHDVLLQMTMGVYDF